MAVVGAVIKIGKSLCAALKHFAKVVMVKLLMLILVVAFRVSSLDVQECDLQTIITEVGLASIRLQILPFSKAVELFCHPRYLLSFTAFIVSPVAFNKKTRRPSLTSSPTHHIPTDARTLARLVLTFTAFISILSSSTADDSNTPTGERHRALIALPPPPLRKTSPRRALQDHCIQTSRDNINFKFKQRRAVGCTCRPQVSPSPSNRGCSRFTRKHCSRLPSLRGLHLQHVSNPQRTYLHALYYRLQTTHLLHEHHLHPTTDESQRRTQSHHRQCLSNLNLERRVQATATANRTRLHPITTVNHLD